MVSTQATTQISTQITKVAKAYPKKHLAWASIASIITLVVLAVLPAPDASAKRTTLRLTPELTSNTAKKPQPTESPTLALEPLTPKTHWSKQTVKSGDTLSHIFKRAGLNAQDVYNITHFGGDSKTLTRLKPGQELLFDINEEGKLNQLNYIESKLESTLFIKTDSSYTVNKTTKKLIAYSKYSEATINNSLFQAGQKAGLSQNLIMELANVFGWDVDFALDIRKGDSFKLIYEEMHLDGEKIKDGTILAAQFINQGKVFTAIQHQSENGSRNYFTPEGHSMRKAFLRSPINFARISSHFNLRRKHPVLHTIRAHKGTDYAASRGTPIKSTGDGKIIYAGRKGGYGRVVIVQHGQRYRTLYAHLNGYAKNARSGKRVKQGQTIGYVGSSGLATGPHLHYEFYLNGAVRNPVTVKLPHAQPIAKNEKARFLLHAESMQTQLAAYASAISPTLASNN
ncbi:MAG: peptidoglycan DD-metalloendopeptidase family protein [Pseudomonadales bacterium]|nr:peptidoglycan DD-metalloendopeptidase family protein [Pseudomonadales bacterium]